MNDLTRSMFGLVLTLLTLSSCASTPATSTQQGGAGQSGVTLDGPGEQAGGAAGAAMTGGAPADSTPACRRLCEPEAALDCATKRTLEQCMTACLEGVTYCPGKLEEWLTCDEMPEVLCVNGMAVLNSRLRRCGAIMLVPPWCWTRQLYLGQGGAPTDGAGGASCAGGSDGGEGVGQEHVEPATPPEGASCPTEGLSLCTRPSGAGAEGALSRCEGGTWRTVERPSACSSMPQECNVGDVPDGACCSVARYCDSHGLCDGQRWWR